MLIGIQSNTPLAPRTTLGVGGSAEYYTEARTLEELRASVHWAQSEEKPITILGGGSNVLVPDAGVRGLVVRPLFSEISYEEQGDEVRVTAGAGVVLDELIQILVGKGLWGLENLSGIPGTVGGVPVQNVGAYGVEAKDVVVSVTTYGLETDVTCVRTVEECAFAYRDSYFKHEGKDEVIIAVTFRLSTQPVPKLSYADLARRFAEDATPTVRKIREAVLDIRSAKFPDWRVVGTAGSFFKNPIITAPAYRALRARYAELPGFEMGGEMVKIPLGWVLDHVCALRGVRKGNVWISEAQALVLVCERGTSAQEVLSFSDEVIARVHATIGITVEREVTLVRG